ncbi:hypothetical protein RHMOL_Rhmol07G0205900 [Rhododendron molle]|uniref:Uncharacterized protein n=1 Tax=Rhododendron molle TaxID=49168 RepID=A0ACC0N4A5_RHOML|nr:hypothetical protein RHMOL_Rhmol07G0205900 [Rhododendron molle]
MGSTNTHTLPSSINNSETFTVPPAPDPPDYPNLGIKKQFAGVDANKVLYKFALKRMRKQARSSPIVL